VISAHSPPAQADTTSTGKRKQFVILAKQLNHGNRERWSNVWYPKYCWGCKGQESC